MASEEIVLLLLVCAGIAVVVMNKKQDSAESVETTGTHGTETRSGEKTEPSSQMTDTDVDTLIGLIRSVLINSGKIIDDFHSKFMSADFHWHDLVQFLKRVKGEPPLRVKLSFDALIESIILQYIDRYPDNYLDEFKYISLDFKGTTFDSKMLVLNEQLALRSTHTGPESEDDKVLIRLFKRLEKVAQVFNSYLSDSDQIPLWKDIISNLKQKDRANMSNKAEVTAFSAFINSMRGIPEGRFSADQVNIIMKNLYKDFKNTELGSNLKSLLDQLK